MAASDARPVPRKNAAFRFYFPIRKPSDSTLITTWAGADSEVSLDGGSYTDCTNEATEIGTTGSGYIDLTSSEMNADCVLLKVTVTNTGAVPLIFALYPEEAGDYRANTVQFSGQTITCAVGVTVLASVGTATTNTPQTGDSYAIINGASGSVATKSVVDAVSAAVTSVSNRIPSMLTADGNIKADALKINGAAPSIPSASDNATAVWAAGTRTLTAFSFEVAVDSEVIAEDVTEALTEAGVTVNDCTQNFLAQLSAVKAITVLGPVVSPTEIRLNQGDDYLTADNRQLRFVNVAGSWGPLTGTAKLYISKTVNGTTTTVECTGTVIVATGPGQRVDVDIPRAKSLLLNSTPWAFDLIATDEDGHKETLRCGDSINRLRRWEE